MKRPVSKKLISKSKGEYIDGHLLALLATSLKGKHNQFSLVFFQPLDIQLQTLFTRIASAVVYCNSQFPSLFRIEAGLFKFFKSKPSTLSYFDVVSQTGTTDGRTKKSSWAGGEGCCTFCASETTTLFASGLVKPCANSTLPILTLTIEKKMVDIPFENGCWEVVDSRVESFYSQIW